MSENILCPLQVEILLHAYVSQSPWPKPSPAADEYIKWAISEELIVGVGLPGSDFGRDCFDILPRGQALVRMILATPLPHQAFIDPRTGNPVHWGEAGEENR